MISANTPDQNERRDVLIFFMRGLPNSVFGLRSPGLVPFLWFHLGLRNACVMCQGRTGPDGELIVAVHVEI